MQCRRTRNCNAAREEDVRLSLEFQADAIKGTFLSVLVFRSLFLSVVRALASI